jgi:spermidine/putrescine transport system ATP-binding protein
MVFQHYALFPHLSVADNVSYGLRQRSPRPARGDIDKAVREALAMVRLPGYENRRVWELSGGQQQRVALARALINRPAVLLLDEPLAALDRKLRREMQIELQNLQRNVGITFLLVTHDQEEALSMSDRVCIMREGRIVQIGSPRQLYDEPANRYVADFVGKSNFFAAKAGKTRRAMTRVSYALGETEGRSLRPTAEGADVVISIRPERMLLAGAAAELPPEPAVRLEARVLNRIFLGEHTEYVVENDKLGAFTVLSPRQAERVDAFAIGEHVAVGWQPESALVLAGD